MKDRAFLLLRSFPPQCTRASLDLCPGPNNSLSSSLTVFTFLHSLTSFSHLKHRSFARACTLPNPQRDIASSCHIQHSTSTFASHQSVSYEWIDGAMYKLVPFTSISVESPSERGRHQLGRGSVGREVKIGVLSPSRHSRAGYVRSLGE